MKKLKSEIRMWLAEKLLGWAFDMTPWDDEGQKLRKHITNYYWSKINKVLVSGENEYIRVYDEMGHQYWGKGSDEQLKKWGNSEERIREIKIQSVRCHLDFHRRGIEVYKELNQNKDE
jgi:hypothetical protein